jgi:hypothetical protein
MNKKLFALLTSAALMAGFVPSVFAADEAPAANLTLKPATETVAPGENASFDVEVSADVQLSTLQFAFTAEGGEIEGFEFNEDNVKALGFDDKGYKGALTPEEKEKFKDNEDYQVMAYDINFEDADKPANTSIGTLTVKPAADAKEGDTITVGTSKAKVEAGGIANYDVDQFAAWTTTDGTVTIKAAEESVKPIDSTPTKEETTTSKPDSSKAEPVSSKPESTSSKEDKSSSSKADSSKATNNTNNNTNTGAASTAAVALAASAAALVVISKKRK